MTLPPDALFDVPAPLPPVGQLLVLAGEYSRHNDSLDVALGRMAPDSSTYAPSAERLAAETTEAITAVGRLKLFDHSDLATALTRLQQVAYLSEAAARHDPAAARVFTAFAPEAVVESAARIAAHMRRRRSAHAPAPDERLDAVQYAALREIALGHVVTTSSSGREYPHSSGERVLLGTLRDLQEHGFIDHAPGSAPAAFHGGPLQNRIRLTLAGATALATVIAPPRASRDMPSAVSPHPAPASANTPSSSHAARPRR
ncbi:hypothetical protein [Streptomyces anulatus]|uniref:hypothetical protein n=1 Tax=Streptomyces anulatus TaxID=1892 RepID=UPI003F4A5DC1